jgi:CspA family cold shock protein
METYISQDCQGVVREFDKTRGCGTIEVETGEQVFVRYSAIVGQGIRTLQRGDHVAFDVEQSSRGPNAVRVKRI